MLVAYTVAEEPKSRKAEGHGGAQFFSNILPWKIKKEINFPHVKRDHLEKLSSPSLSLSLPDWHANPGQLTVRVNLKVSSD